MVEGPLLLALMARALEIRPVPGRVPRPVAQLTVRSASGIWLSLRPRGAAGK
jgi:hypothetical protein